MPRRSALALLIVAALQGMAAAQPAVPKWSPLPPGSNGYFGSSIDDSFGPQTAFPSSPAPPPPPKPEGSAPVIPFVPGDDLLPPPKPSPPPPPPPINWAGSADIGLNGASGNTNLFNLRTGWHAERKTPNNLFIGDFLYAYLKQEQKTEQQQALLNVRDEILFPGHPWSLFTATQVEYDELRDYRFRVGIYGGAGYTVLDSKQTLFRVRSGAGATREIGVDGAQSQWVPEAVFGYDLRYRLDDRNSLVSVFDYYPRISDWSQYRVRFRAAYEVLLDARRGTVLRVGVQDRYDSNPGNANRNDVTYFATLGVKF